VRASSPQIGETEKGNGLRNLGCEKEKREKEKEKLNCFDLTIVIPYGSHQDHTT
jgi:hypothetical protein